MKRFFSILLVIGSMLPLMASAQEPTHHVIIDTDGGPDDLRALNLMLSSGETEILAITSSDGILDPEEGLMKVRSLLNYHGHQGISTSQGIITQNKASQKQALARAIQWGKEPLSYEPSGDVKEFLVKKIEQEPDPVEIICLGPLTNIANAILMKPSIKQEISRILWFDDCQRELPCSNYGMDRLSADYILGTKIPVYRIKSNQPGVKLEGNFFSKLLTLPSPYARNIYQTHQHDSLQNRMEAGEIRVRNELVPLYLYHPGYFERDTSYADSMGHVMKTRAPDSVLTWIYRYLKKPASLHHVTFKDFPTDSSLYRTDIKPLVRRLIRNHGIKEWHAVILTSEMQGQLNIGNVLGAKMGIRILEYFHTSPGEVTLTCHITQDDPLSNMVDGLQMATQATTGNGKLTIQQSPSNHVVAKHENQAIEISLKTNYLKKATGSIERTPTPFRPSSQNYQQEQRKKALQFWADWERKSIFQVIRKNNN